QGNGDGGAAARLFSQDRWSSARISSIADKSYGTGGGAATARGCCARSCYTTSSKRARTESTEGYSCFTAARAPDGWRVGSRPLVDRQYPCSKPFLLLRAKYSWMTRSSFQGRNEDLGIILLREKRFCLALF